MTSCLDPLARIVFGLCTLYRHSVSFNKHDVIIKFVVILRFRKKTLIFPTYVVILFLKVYIKPDIKILLSSY